MYFDSSMPYSSRVDHDHNSLSTRSVDSMGDFQIDIIDQ